MKKEGVIHELWLLWVRAEADKVMLEAMLVNTEYKMTPQEMFRELANKRSSPQYKSMIDTAEERFMKAKSLEQLLPLATPTTPEESQTA